MNNDEKLSRSQWSKTPYAKTKAGNTDASISVLLRKYGVVNHQWTQGAGPNRRAAVLFRFEFSEKRYRIKVETLCADASQDELIMQAKRAVYYYLKSTLEMVSVFWPLEKAMFAFLELPHEGVTMYEAAEPHLKQMKAPDFGKLMLPGPGH